MSTIRAPIEALPMPRKDEESRNTVLDRKNTRTRQRCTAQALWHAINAERENSANRGFHTPDRNAALVR